MVDDPRFDICGLDEETHNAAMVGVRALRTRRLANDPHLRARWSKSLQVWQIIGNNNSLVSFGPTELTAWENAYDILSLF